jgi:hypothetical protein
LEAAEAAADLITIQMRTAPLVDRAAEQFTLLELEALEQRVRAIRAVMA